MPASSMITKVDGPTAAAQSGRSPCRKDQVSLAKIIYTTNSVESLNYQLRKIIKNRGHFPNDDAVVKLLWLAIRDIEEKRARERPKEAGRAKGQPRKAPPKLVEGATVQGWNAAYGALSLAFPGRLEMTL
jgi:putative transposase